LAGLELLGDKASAVNEEVIRGALPEVRWPGRLEFFQDCRWQGKARAVLLDGAHNPAGVESLMVALGSDFRYDKLIMVWASMGDKDFQSCVSSIVAICDKMIFTRPESTRSATPAQLLQTLSESDREKSLPSLSVQEALTLAYDLAGPTDLICVAGSLYLVGKVRSLLVGDLLVD
jgi:dihydrofolate synthase/folylpolyglutamate synthase